MAKMFYSVEEAAQRLGKTAEQVREMAASGQLQEFRDRDKLMFKREQVDLLAGDGPGDSGMIPLADVKGGSGLELSLEDSGAALGPKAAPGRPAPTKSGSGSGIELDAPPAERDAKQRSGISIFDTDTEESDPLAATRITEATRGPELNMDQVGSGSGLMDLTREGDDTSLGADLLEDVYKPDADGGETSGSSGLFEPTAAPSDVSAAAAAPAMVIAAEPYDGVWSGIGGGLALGALLVAAAGLFAVLSGILGGADNSLVQMMTGSLMMWIGIFAGIILVGAVIGFVLGRRG